MRKVRKAVIPVAGMGTRLYPASKAVKKELFPLVGPDGLAKPLIHFVVEEAVMAGVEEVCLVTRAGEEALFESYFNDPLPHDVGKKLDALDWAREQTKQLANLGERISYAVQNEQRGYGHAVYCAKEWVGDEPFLHMLGDHVYTSRTGMCCARQIIDVFEKFDGAVSSVRRTPESHLHLYGAMAGDRVAPNVYEVTELKEKPDADYARSHLRVEGLPEGTYLCFFGQHVLTPIIFDYLEYHIVNDIRERGEIQLTSSLNMLTKEAGKYYAFETEGERYDIGVPEEYVATIADFSAQKTEA